MNHFILNNSAPKKLVVHCTSPMDSATKFYSVVADYGWAQKILCSGSYLDDANSIATLLAHALNIPYEKA